MKRTTMILMGLLVLGAMGCDGDDRRVEPDRRHHRRHVEMAGIQGVVVDQDGRAIANHPVQFMHKDRVWRGRTNDEGYYVFRDLPSEYEGRVVVYYEDQEFVERVRLPRRGYGQCEMRIRHRHRRPKPDPRRHYCEVVGRVYVGRQAQPNTDVVLQIRGQRDRTARTNKHGVYTFSRVPLEHRGRVSIQRPGAQGSIAIYTGNRPGEVRVDKLYIKQLPAPTPHRRADRRDGHRPPDAPTHNTTPRRDRKEKERRAEERRQQERDRARDEEAARLRKQQAAKAEAYRQQRERARQRKAAAADLKRQEEKKEARRKQQEHMQKRAAIEAHLKKQQELKQAHQDRVAQAMKKVDEARARQQRHRRAEAEKAEEPVKKQRPGRQRRKSEPKPEPTPEPAPEVTPEPEPVAEPEEDRPATRRSRRRKN